MLCISWPRTHSRAHPATGSPSPNRCDDATAAARRPKCLGRSNQVVYLVRMDAQPAAPPRFVASLALVLAGFAILSGIGCHYPEDWLLENMLVGGAVTYLWLTYRTVPLSRTSYVLILVFLGLHEVGAHTTFAKVPYDDWFLSLFGVAVNDLFGWQRNHYDRFVHLIYGLLLALPYQETINRRLGTSGFASYFLTWIFILATSGFYELLEWVAALFVGGDLGQAYLGTQGDEWDSHKDTALALLGATVALSIRALWPAQPRPRS